MLNSQFRKTSQSVYQPTNNKSALGQTKFNATLQGSAFLGKSSLPGSRNLQLIQVKKIEGQDVLGTSKISFEQKINKLKSKPNQKVLQDEYIKGLQEEIKYLEYELKLLKDKEIIEREGVNELDNFLKDQIPINQNILAMKNKYNATKSKLEEQFKLFSQKNIEASDVLKTQKNQITRLHDIIDGHRKQVGQRGKQFKQKLQSLVKQLTLTNDQSVTLSESNKVLQEKIRKMTEQISAIQRSIEKEKVLEVRAVQQKTKNQQKFDEKNKKTKEDMLQALQKVQDVIQYQTKKGTNPLADELIQKNSVLRKKIMVNQKNISTFENIISQIELFLQEQTREREIERKQKLKITIQIEQIRNQIQNFQRNTQNMIKEQTLRTKKIMIKQMEHDFKEKQEIYQKLVDRLSYLEQACSNLITEKKDFQDSLESQQNKEKNLLKLINSLEEEILLNRCSSQSLIRINKEIQQQIVSLKNQLQKCTDRIPMVESEIEKKNVMINHLSKQLELIKQLKGLDLDHLQMISTSGIQIQNTLHDFIKNWEKLKSL